MSWLTHCRSLSESLFLYYFDYRSVYNFVSFGGFLFFYYFVVSNSLSQSAYPVPGPQTTGSLELLTTLKRIEGPDELVAAAFRLSAVAMLGVEIESLKNELRVI